MKSKEDFYIHIENIREILRNKNNLKCSCPKLKCEWHGKCKECIAIHRYNKDHFPNCLQIIFNDRIKALASVGELNALEKEKTPPEYWDYIRERDKENITLY